jgi:hypothetical protein
LEVISISDVWTKDEYTWVELSLLLLHPDFRGKYEDLWRFTNCWGEDLHPLSLGLDINRNGNIVYNDLENYESYCNERVSALQDLEDRYESLTGAPPRKHPIEAVKRNLTSILKEMLDQHFADERALIELEDVSTMNEKGIVSEECKHCEGSGIVLYDCGEPGHWDQDTLGELCNHCGKNWEEGECPRCLGVS